MCTLLLSLVSPIPAFADEEKSSKAKPASEGTTNYNPASRNISEIRDSATLVPATNSDIDGDDDCNNSPIELGFDFEYYGETYDEVYLSTNGTVSFTKVLNPDYVEGESDPEEEFLCFEEYDNDFTFLDSSGDTEDLHDNTIYAFWDDLDSSFDNIFYQTLGEPGTQQFVVQWTNSYSHFQGTDEAEDYANYGPPLGTFQVILDEVTGNITMQYLDMKLGNYGEGMLATIGLTGDTQNDEYLVYSHLEETLEPNMAIEFSQDGNSYDFDDVVLQDIYLDDVILPDTGLNFWYEFDESLEDSAKNNSDLELTGDPVQYSTEGTLDFPMASSNGDSSVIVNEDLELGSQTLQFVFAIKPNTLPEEGNVSQVLYLGNGLAAPRVLIRLLDDGHLSIETNLAGTESKNITTTDPISLDQVTFVSLFFDFFEKQWTISLNNQFQGSTETYENEGNFGDITALGLALGTGIVAGNIEAFDGSIGGLGVWEEYQDEEYITNIYNEGNLRPYDYMFETNSTTTTPTLNWHDFTGNDTYELIVSTSPNFEAGTEDEEDYDRLNNTIVFQEDDIEDLNYTFDPDTTPFREGETYYWMVLALNGYTEGDPAIQTSAVSSFTIPYTYDFTGEGAGIEGNPYLISDCAELLEVNELLFGDNYFRLDTDLYCSLVGNDMILGSEFSGFEGVFDGAGNSIILDLNGDSHVGLFAKLSGAEVQNLTVEGNFSGTMVGSIAGLAVESTLQNVTTTANTIVNGFGKEYIDEETPEVEDNAGGLVGYLYRSDLRDSFSNAVVTGDWENIGGAVGHAVRSEIGNSGSDSVVNGNTDTGGFAGDIDISTVYDSYSDGIVSGVEFIGGFVGDTDTFVNYERVYSNASVTGTDGDVGGLIGTADDYVILNEVYSTGDVTGQSPAVPDENDEIDGFENFYAGGLIGDIDNGVEITDAYALGDVSGDIVGGLIGKIDNDYTPTVITNTYSKGEVTSNGEYGLGGLIAILDDENSVLSSHWNTETSGTAVSAAGEGITIAQMQTQSTFEGWNFEDIWVIDSNKVLNSGYPYFGWQESILEYTDEVASTSGGGGSSGSRVKNKAELDYIEEVSQVIAEKVVTENPEGLTNKCEALTIMSRVFKWEVPVSTSTQYIDVPTWCTDVAAYGTERGIVEGRTATTLGMETPVTRYEIAVMLYRELQKQNYEFKGTQTVSFSDSLTPWAKEAVEVLAKEGIINGFANGTFGGEKGILKQDAAIMMLRFLKKTNNYIVQ